MDVYQVDDNGQLFISPAIESWDPLAAHGIDTIIDLEGGLDDHIPTTSNHCLYVYFPINDDNEQLPCMVRLHAIAKLAAALIADGHRVLSHCGMGFNPAIYYVIGDRLAQPADKWRKFERTGVRCFIYPDAIYAARRPRAAGVA